MKEKITIMGGGIAGLSIAIALQKRGYECEVFESAFALKPVGAGIVLAFNAMRAANQLGIAEDLKRAGEPIKQMCITDHRCNVLSSMNYESHLAEFEELTLAIHRHSLHHVLLQHVTEGTLKLGKKVIGFQQNESSCMVRFEDQTEIETKYLIAADGIHSIFRQQLLPGSKPRFSGYTCWRGIGNLPSSYPYKDKVIEAWGHGERIGIVPLANNRVYWFAVKNAKEKEEEFRSATKDQIVDYFKGWDPHLVQVLENTDTNSIIWNDLSDIKPISRFAFGNILLAGDAAHATTPNMGQGGCQALEDAAVLLAILGKEVPLEKAFKEFEEKRVARTKRVIQTSRRIGQLAHLSNPILCAIRNAAIRLTPESMAIKQIRWLNRTDF